jgi:hypothetical protein
MSQGRYYKFPMYNATSRIRQPRRLLLKLNQLRSAAVELCFLADGRPDCESYTSKALPRLSSLFVRESSHARGMVVAAIPPIILRLLSSLNFSLSAVGGDPYVFCKAKPAFGEPPGFYRGAVYDGLRIRRFERREGGCVVNIRAANRAGQRHGG